MNKTNKRYMNLRNKLFAAIAMLLVSSIMMVSSTYAWFTLSTAPEVQGITTTVGTNGNLEIALSPLSGETGGITSGVNDSTQDWIIKNTTWGNLLDMSNSAYELDKIVLQPSQLVFANGKIQNGGLAYPVYGSDGRISKLDNTRTQIGGKVDEDNVDTTVTLSEDFQVLANGGYGVRAVGTSSGLTENQRVFNSGVSALRNGMNNASGVASSAMNTNGQALANMMVDHAMATKYHLTENFAPYSDELDALVASLESSVANIDSALKGFLTAYVATVKAGTELSTAVTTIENATDLSALMTTLGVTNETLTAALAQRDAINSKVVAARTTLTGITDWTSWTQVSAILTHLMNIDGKTSDDKAAVTVNDLSYEQINADVNVMINNLIANKYVATIKLNENSGIYYDIHAMASKIYASTTMEVDASKVLGGETLIMPVDTVIETTFNGTTTLGGMLTATNTMTPKAEDAGTEGAKAIKLDVYYGYILDFVFRTNAANSSLQLQTEAANRVYTDGTEATMGGGSTISFQVPAGVNSGIVKGMLDGIRVVFFNTADGTVYGVAKATSATATEAEDGSITWVGKLELCETTVDAFGYVKATTAKTGNNAATLCALNQNQPQRVSAMVCLDGNDITNEDILAEGNLAGTLNLQFSSSAALVPMENSALKTMESYDVLIGGVKADTIEQGGTYTYTIDAATKEVVQSVTVTMGGTALNDAYNAETGVITVPNASGEISITITKQTIQVNFAPSEGFAYEYAGESNNFTKGAEIPFKLLVADGYEVTGVTYTPYEAEGVEGQSVPLIAVGENEYKISAQQAMVDCKIVVTTKLIETPAEGGEDNG